MSDTIFEDDYQTIIERQEREIERLRAVLERTLDYLADKKIPRQNIAGLIRAAARP